jgi:hypothetical protein
MHTLIVCLDPKSDERSEVDKIVNSGLFATVYIVGDLSNIDYYKNLSKIKVFSIPVISSSPIEELQDKLLKELKKAFGQNKMMDMDIALNISSGNGRLHASIISTVMKLGYGIRLVGLDKEGDVAEL